MKANQPLEQRIAHWRDHLQRYPSIRPGDAAELEDHLRSQIEALSEVGLDEDESFLVAVKRMGEMSSLSREFAQEYSEHLWKQLLGPVSAPEVESGQSHDSRIAVSLAVGAAIAVKIPEIFGYRFTGHGDFYALNMSLLILPFLAAWFAWKRKLTAGALVMVAVPFLAAALLMNLLPFRSYQATEMLAVIHLPIALWFVAGIAYMGGRWVSHPHRMNLIRFSGEWFIYGTLIAFGGGVLMMFTVFIFKSIGIDARVVVQEWILPCGIAGAAVVSGWLVEAKQNIIENMAPVLTRLFTPLFTVLLLSYIGAMIWEGSGVLANRDVLIGFDLLLVLILGLLLYSISARDPEAAPNLFDRMQLVLVVSALVVDIIALWAIGRRITEFGYSPNKVAALGENLILLVNLMGSALLYVRFLLNRAPFSALERWQTAYIPVYPIWAGIVAVLFPILFNFR